MTIQLVCHIEREHVRAFLRAVETLGVSSDEFEQGTEIWLYSPKQPDGFPVQARLPARIDGTRHPAYVVLLPHGAKSTLETTKFRLSLEVEEEDCEVGRAVLAKFVRRLDAERRLEAIGINHFLGVEKDPIIWSRSWPAIDLPLVMPVLEELLSDWELVRTGSPRGRALSRTRVPDTSSGEVFVYQNARFYYRKQPDSWLVVDLLTNQQLFQLDIAGSGVTDAWQGELLDNIETRFEQLGARIDRKMRLSGDELELEREFAWDDLFLDALLKQDLREEVEQFFERRDHYQELGIPHQRGLLIHGPPGTGKTLLGKVLVSQLADAAFVWVTAGDVPSAKEITAIFTLARRCDRCVLFFEDLDFFAAARDSHYGHERGRLGELLVQLDGMQSNSGLLVIATTNDVQAIEPALKDRPSRFDRVFEFGPPPFEVRVLHLQNLLRNRPYDEEALPAIARRTDGFTGAQLQELASIALRRAAGRGVTEVAEEDLLAALEGASNYRAKPAVGFGRSDDSGDRFDYFD